MLSYQNHQKTKSPKFNIYQIIVTFRKLLKFWQTDKLKIKSKIKPQLTKLIRAFYQIAKQYASQSNRRICQLLTHLFVIGIRKTQRPLASFFQNLFIILLRR